MRGARIVLSSCCVVVLSFLLAGCAYFNTFYFAKRHFAAAERIREKSEAENSLGGASGTELVSQDAVRRYDDAILQCKKVLNYHAGSRWTDDAVFLLGASYYGKAAYDSALVTLDGFVEGFPESEFVPRAQYIRGLALHERGKYPEMEAAFDAALAADPKFKQKDGILFTLARTAEKQGDREEAIHRYRYLVDSFANQDRGEDGLLEIGRLYFEAGIYDSALTAFSELAGRTKNQERYEESQLQIGESLVRLGRADEAIDRLQRQLPRVDPTARDRSDYPARVRLGLAQALNRQGRHFEAIETLDKVIETQKTSPYAHEAQYQIGYTYESYLDSLDAAEKAYEEAAKMNLRPAFRELAKNRVLDLRKLRALSTQERSETDTDLEKRAGAALQIAELYYYSKRDVAAALIQYEKVIEDYPASRMAARAAYAIAWIQLQEEDLSDETGYVGLRDLVADYPESEQARSAISLLASAGADTSGLAELLVEPEPPADAEDLADPSLGPEAGRIGVSRLVGGPPDSLGISPVLLDSLGNRIGRAADPRLSRRFSLVDSLGRPVPDPAAEDTVGSGPAPEEGMGMPAESDTVEARPLRAPLEP